MAARLGIEIFVEDVGVVKVPGTGTNGDESEKQGGRNQAGRSLQGQPGAGAQGVFGSATREGNGDNSEHGRDRKPVGNRPEHRRDEVAVAVHVGVGVRGDLSEEIQRVFPAERWKDLQQDEDADHNAVPYKFVGDHGLDEESEKDKGQDLWQGHYIEFLEILPQLVVVITGDGLHENAHDHGEPEQYQFDDDDRSDAGEPVCGLPHGQSVVNAFEMCVALAPQ